MASYSCEVSSISRGAGRSAPGAAAYRHGARLTDERTGETFDYTRRSGVEAQGLDGAADLAALWRAAEAAEKRKDACVAREVRFSLPCELDTEQRAAVCRDVAAALRERYGVACSWAAHLPGAESDQRNTHCHLLMTTRAVDAAGVFGAKTRQLDTPATRGAEVQAIREIVERAGNDALARAGHARSLDRRSFKARKEAGELPAEALPTRHLGPSATGMERRGVRTSAGDHNRQVARLRAAADEAADLARQIEVERRHVAAEAAAARMRDWQRNPSPAALAIRERLTAPAKRAVEAEALRRLEAQRQAVAVEAARQAEIREATLARAAAALDTARETARALVGAAEARWITTQRSTEAAAVDVAEKAVTVAQAALHAAGDAPPWWAFWRAAARREHEDLVAAVSAAEGTHRAAERVLRRRDEWIDSPAGRIARNAALEAARTAAERQVVLPAQMAHEEALRVAQRSPEPDPDGSGNPKPG